MSHGVQVANLEVSLSVSKAYVFNHCAVLLLIISPAPQSSLEHLAGPGASRYIL